MRLLRNLLLAIRFLTIIPLPQRREDTPDDMALAVYWFPCVGFGIGAAALGCCKALPAGVDPMILSAVAVAFLAIVTGAIHLDGLSDTCDGVFGGSDPESRLRIMKDKATGSFGTVAVVIALLLKFACLASLIGSGAALFVLPLGVAAARWSQVIGAGVSSYARSEGGTGRSFVDGVGLRHVVLSLVPLAALWYCAYMALMPSSAGSAAVNPFCYFAFVLVGVLVISLCLAAFFRAKIGGVTGDALGAMAEVAEVVVFGLAAVLWSSRPWDGWF